MHFEPNMLYHIYNRGNNKTQIFFNRENYLFFLKKLRKHLLHHCEFLSFCLMPNHFHFLLYTKEIDQTNNQSSNVHKTATGQTGTANKHPLIQGIATLLSSYTQAINKQENRSGSLFQQKTKAKCLTESSQDSYPSDDYSFICFNYIHQNPMTSGLVRKMEDWEFSSFKDYVRLREGTLCNKVLAKHLLDLPEEEDLYEMSYEVIDPEKINIFYSF